MDEIESVLARLEQGNIPVERITVKNDQTFSCTAGELLACCKKNPSHPSAIVFQQACGGLPPEHEVHVDRVDLEALLQNKTVKISRSQTAEFIGGKQQIVTTTTKTLEGGSNDSTKPASSPTDPPAS